MIIGPAKGTKGHLIWCIDGQLRFRVYTGLSDFIDYDIIHSDLSITITDSDASFYFDEFGHRLDHNPDTLGVKE